MTIRKTAQKLRKLVQIHVRAKVIIDKNEATVSETAKLAGHSLLGKFYEYFSIKLATNYIEQWPTRPVS